MPALVSACRECNYFDNRCLGAGIVHTVLEIPGLHHKKLKRLSAEGTIDLSRIPDDLELNDRQQRAMNAALSGRPIIMATGLAAALAGISWPCHYLDFETVATAMPLYEGHACHQQVLTQFSIHHRDDISAEPSHSEYLADAARDCQYQVAAALIAALGEKGAIIVYSSFEKTRITALRDAFPELAAPLDMILGRLVDLLSFITDYVSHPDFKGSYSIKKVLPTLVPDLSYKGLRSPTAIAAITRFARAARGEITGSMTSNPHAATSWIIASLEYFRDASIARNAARNGRSDGDRTCGMSAIVRLFTARKCRRRNASDSIRFFRQTSRSAGVRVANRGKVV